MAPGKDWDRQFFNPIPLIPLPKGKPLVTLRDAANYIIKLPKSKQDTQPWQTAMRTLILCADHSDGDDPYLASIGMMCALYPAGERVFRPQRPASGQAEVEAGWVKVLPSSPPGYPHQKNVRGDFRASSLALALWLGKYGSNASIAGVR